jgi:hypothetical protein
MKNKKTRMWKGFHEMSFEESTRLSVSKAVSTKSVITPLWEVQMMICFLSVKLDSISFPSMYVMHHVTS